MPEPETKDLLVRPKRLFWELNPGPLASGVGLHLMQVVPLDNLAIVFTPCFSSHYHDHLPGCREVLFLILILAKITILDMHLII